MFRLLTVFLIVCISISLIIYKKKYIFNSLRLKRNVTQKKLKNIDRNNLKINKRNKNNEKFFDIQNYSYAEKTILKKQMLDLFKGTKDQKIKALKIAGSLSDKSTLPILKLGLKDMDSDVVKISAKLIQRFK